MTLPVPIELLTAAMLATYFAAVLQSSIGFGFSLFSVSILTFVDPRLAPGPQLFIVLPLGLAVLLRERHALQWQGAAWIIFGRLLGTVPGAVMLIYLSQSHLNIIIAGFILVAVAAIVFKRPIPRNTATKCGAGVVSEIMSSLSSIGGPPVALLYADAKGPVVRTTLSAVFLIGVLFSIAVRAYSGKLQSGDWQIALYCWPCAALGFATSGKITQHLEGRFLKAIILIVSTAAALGLLIRTLL